MNFVSLSKSAANQKCSLIINLLRAHAGGSKPEQVKSSKLKDLKFGKNDTLTAEPMTQKTKAKWLTLILSIDVAHNQRWERRNDLPYLIIDKTSKCNFNIRSLQFIAYWRNSTNNIILYNQTKGQTLRIEIINWSSDMKANSLSYWQYDIVRITPLTIMSLQQLIFDQVITPLASCLVVKNLFVWGTIWIHPRAKISCNSPRSRLILCQIESSKKRQRDEDCIRLTSKSRVSKRWWYWSSDHFHSVRVHKKSRKRRLCSLPL